MIPIANPELGEDEKARVREILDSGMIADGPEVRTFEEEFAEFIDTDHAVATSNGTTALQTALSAIGVGEGDKVLTTPFSFVASSNAIRFAGADPVFADINPETFNLDPGKARKVLEDQTITAILVVHLYGLPADLESFKSLSEEFDIPLIEDAAQAHGAMVGEEKVGSVGDVGCFSFYPTKNMTTAEGGMITTDDEELAERAASFANHGRSEGYEHVRLGHNFRMTSIAAAIGRGQLKRLTDYNNRRRENAAKLNEGLAGTPLKTPTEPDNRHHVYHQYTVSSNYRDELKSHLESENIGSGVYYPTPIHELKAYDHVEYSLPLAENEANKVLSLPVHPSLEDHDIETINKAVRDFYRNE